MPSVHSHLLSERLETAQSGRMGWGPEWSEAAKGQVRDAGGYTAHGPFGRGTPIKAPGLGGLTLLPEPARRSCGRNVTKIRRAGTQLPQARKMRWIVTF